jgi:CRISPR type III-B/RAMP module RAMP protein Cmr6
MAQKKGQQSQTFNSLEALANIGKPQAEVRPITNRVSGDASMNFYSFLHKRNRFFEKDVIIEGRSLKDHMRFDVKKITIEEVIEDNSSRRPRPKQIQLLDSFTKWQKDVFYEANAKRHLRNAQSICSEVKEQNFKPDWRLAIGLGTGSIFETSMSLHHVHGFPYIPASGIKGIVRSYLVTTIFGTEGIPPREEDFPLINAEFRALTKSKDFCKLFGCPADIQAVTFNGNNPVFKKDKNGKDTKDYEKEKATGVALKNDKGKGEENQGSIIFFDAYPISSPKDKIKADIMNPHYPDYYNDKDSKAPTDYQNPIPILFLTVEDLSFQFIVGLKKGKDDFNIEIGQYKGKVLEQVALMLKDALKEHGIGAKTAVGYGYMQEQTK